jgi:hypothetical protein
MRARILFPKIIRVKLENADSSQKPSFKNILMFGSGTLLAISESLPFMTDIKANGILDAIKKIREEYKDF